MQPSKHFWACYLTCNVASYHAADASDQTRAVHDAAIHFGGRITSALAHCRFARNATNHSGEDDDVEQTLHDSNNRGHLVW